MGPGHLWANANSLPASHSRATCYPHMFSSKASYLPAREVKRLHALWLEALLDVAIVYSNCLFSYCASEMMLLQISFLHMIHGRLNNLNVSFPELAIPPPSMLLLTGLLRRAPFAVNWLPPTHIRVPHHCSHMQKPTESCMIAPTLHSFSIYKLKLFFGFTISNLKLALWSQDQIATLTSQRAMQKNNAKRKIFKIASILFARLKIMFGESGSIINPMGIHSLLR